LFALDDAHGVPALIVGVNEQEVRRARGRCTDCPAFEKRHEGEERKPGKCATSNEPFGENVHRIDRHTAGLTDYARGIMGRWLWRWSNALGHLAMFR
jgi:hypothetical protein